jgi:hypothetical protein
MENDEPSKEARIHTLRKPLWIGYGRAQMIRNRLEELLTWPPAPRMPGYAVVGESLNGKTYLLDNLHRRHVKPLSTSPAQSLADLPEPQLPIAMVQAPPEPTEERVYDAILQKLGMLGSPRERVIHKCSRLLKTCESLHVRMLVMDEFGFFGAVGPEKQRKALNAVKFVMNELRIPVVLATVPSGLNVLHSDDQIANRFEPLHLPKWKKNPEGVERKELERFLKSLEQALGLRRPSGLHEEELAGEIVDHANGILGHMCELVRRLAEDAIRTGQECITKNSFASDNLKKLNWVHPTKRHARPS